VAYALAGRIDIDLTNDPLGEDPNGKPVYLRDIWPSNEEVRKTVRAAVHREMFQQEYARAFDGDDNWQGMPVPTGEIYHWDSRSTYIKKPPYFDHMVDPETSVTDLSGLRVLALLGDSVTTDHISPAGSIPKEGPAGRYLIAQGVEPKDFNSYGARRGNHEVMVRGTLANIRLRNQLAPGTEGGWTQHLPGGEQMYIYDASIKYQEEGVPLMIIAGKEYGSGSSRDWAAKGVLLLGVKAVIAESFERIHRTNLVGMGVLPLQFRAGENAASLKLTGREAYQVTGVRSALSEGGKRQATVRAVAGDGPDKVFTVDVRVDTPQEVEYYRYGGILPYVLRQVAAGASA
jgi:aconitate hydratase